MHPCYDIQLENCWKELLRKKKTSRVERFDYVLAHAANLIPKENDVPLQTPIKKTNCRHWKLHKVYVSCLSNKSYTCICSQSVDRFYLIKNDQGVVLRIGKECIAKILSGTDLELAKREMELAETEEAEFRKQRESERISINSQFDIDI